MEKRQMRITKLRDEAVVPTYGSEFSAGADLYACIPEAVKIMPGETAFIPTGLAMEIPVGYGGFIFARSGLACKRDVAPANKVGVIDSDYRGEVTVALHNHGKTEQVIEPKERIAQIVFLPVLTADFIVSDSLDETERGAGGFGSTGRK